MEFRQVEQPCRTAAWCSWCRNPNAADAAQRWDTVHCTAGTQPAEVLQHTMTHILQACTSSKVPSLARDEQSCAAAARVCRRKDSVGDANCSARTAITLWAETLRQRRRRSPRLCWQRSRRLALLPPRQCRRRQWVVPAPRQPPGQQPGVRRLAPAADISDEVASDQGTQ